MLWTLKSLVNMTLRCHKSFNSGANRIQGVSGLRFHLTLLSLNLYPLTCFEIHYFHFMLKVTLSTNKRPRLPHGYLVFYHFITQSLPTAYQEFL